MFYLITYEGEIYLAYPEVNDLSSSKKSTRISERGKRTRTMTLESSMYD